jgi:hypothetical protein
MPDDSPYLDDPRTCQPEKATLDEVLLDLDEAERGQCRFLAKRLERTFRASERFDLNMIPTLWSVAHDQAICDVAEARARAKLNGCGDWDSGTWGERKDGAVKA